MPTKGFHGHVEEAYLRFMDKRLKEKRAAMGLNPLIRNFYIKIPNKEAKSGAPLSPILTPHGVNLNEFVTKFNNDKTGENYGSSVPIPTVVSVFENRTFKMYLTQIFSILFYSGNHNRYRFYKPKDLYKRLKMAYSNFNNLPRRTWPEIDLLFRKTRKNYLNSTISAERKNKFNNNNNNKIEKKHLIDLQNYLKTGLSTIKSTKVYVRTNKNLLKRAGYFNISSLRFGFKIFLKKNQKELLSRKELSLQNRIKKLKKKNLKAYLYFNAHKNIKKVNKILKIK
jgi:hypothetical protein